MWRIVPPCAIECLDGWVSEPTNICLYLRVKDVLIMIHPSDTA